MNHSWKKQRVACVQKEKIAVKSQQVSPPPPPRNCSLSDLHEQTKEHSIPIHSLSKVGLYVSAHWLLSVAYVQPGVRAVPMIFEKKTQQQTTLCDLTVFSPRGVDPFFGWGWGCKSKKNNFANCKFAIWFCSALRCFLNLFLHYILWIFQVVEIIGGGGAKRYVCHPNIFMGATAPCPPPPRIDASVFTFSIQANPFPPDVHEYIISVSKYY